MQGESDVNGETKEHRERRIEELWKTLDTSGKGELDFNGFRKGLKKIDHRMETSNIYTNL